MKKKILSGVMAVLMMLSMGCSDSSSKKSSTKKTTTTTTMVTTTTNSVTESSKAETKHLDEKELTDYLVKRAGELCSAFPEFSVPVSEDDPSFYRQASESSGIVYSFPAIHIQYEYEDTQFFIKLAYAETADFDINKPDLITISLNRAGSNHYINEKNNEPFTDKESVDWLNDRYGKAAMKIALFFTEGNTNEKKVDSFYRFNINDSNNKVSTINDGVCGQNLYTIDNYSYAVLFWAYNNSVVHFKGDVQCGKIDSETDISEHKNLKASADGTLAIAERTTEQSTTTTTDQTTAAITSRKKTTATGKATGDRPKIKGEVNLYSAYDTLLKKESFSIAPDLSNSGLTLQATGNDIIESLDKTFGSNGKWEKKSQSIAGKTYEFTGTTTDPYGNKLTFTMTLTVHTDYNAIEDTRFVGTFTHDSQTMNNTDIFKFIFT